MPTTLPIPTIVHAIQLAVAPVFLLTGVASILSVLTNRLGRIIDRKRFLHINPLNETSLAPNIQQELSSLRLRAHLIHWAIGLCTACLLLICSVIALLFIGSFVDVDLLLVISVLFIIAMLCLIVALLCLIGEIYQATENIRRE